MSVDTEGIEPVFQSPPNRAVLNPVFNRIQREQAEWSARNFPTQADYQPVMGIDEEVGELCEAELLNDSAKMHDSLGDIFVYGLNVCNRYGFHFARLTGWAEEFKREYDTKYARKCLLLRAAALAGKLAHHQLKMDQGIRGTPAEHRAAMEPLLAELWAVLEIYAACNGWSLTAVLVATWQEVMQRDWLKNSVSGAA